MKKTYRIDGLDCANCAAKIERAIAGLDGVETASIDFMARRMFLTAPDDRFEEIDQSAQRLISKIEPGAAVYPLGGGRKKAPASHAHPHEHSHDGCSCGHGHEHHHEHGGGQEHKHAETAPEEHGHSHSHGGESPSEQLGQLIRILVSGVLFSPCL